MEFADYDEFRASVLILADGDEATIDTFSTQTLDLIIGLAENRVYRDLRASSMLAPLSVAISNNAATLPADLIELKEVYLDATRPIEIVPLERLRTLAGGGNTVQAAQDGDTLIFWPAASGTLTGRYYKRPSGLKTGTWANQSTFARYPEAFVYASLVEAAPFLGFTDRVQVWEGKYREALATATREENLRAFGGLHLRVRTR